MRKCIAFCLAVILLIGSLAAYNGFLDNAIQKRKRNLRYNNTNAKLDCIDALANTLDSNSILVLGSSELNNAKEASYPGNLFDNGNSDFNMVFVGYGSYCSLQHALYLGALSKSLPQKKVVLIVSPQWFDNTNTLTPGAFSSRFSQRAFDGFIKNKQISGDTKRQIVDRCETMLSADAHEQNVVRMYDAAYLKGSYNFLDRLYLFTDNLFWIVKTKRDVVRYVRQDKTPVNPEVKAESIDFDQLMASEEKEGKANSTNNPFYIDDTYYNKNVSNILYYKDKATGRTLTNSAEYGDLDLFLQVCKETGVQPLLVCLPVNGYYYDYMNFSQSERKQYYQNIRDIASKYGVALADFSSDEYTKYFFVDTWHIGWKGWTAVDKSIYEFYKQGASSSAQ